MAVFTILFLSLCFFFFNDTATTEIYTLSLHDALPIARQLVRQDLDCHFAPEPRIPRSEEHTSELQSRQYLVCRLLLEKKKTHIYTTYQSKKKQYQTQNTNNKTNR